MSHVPPNMANASQGPSDGSSGSSHHDLLAELALAQRAADAADAITLGLYERHDFEVEWKPNRTEVTEADRRTERTIGELLVGERPSHGVFGEEYGLIGDAASAWRWIIDPIDGTSNFVRGIPVWATLVALCHHDEPVVGVVSAPALRRRWWAARGHGAFVDGRACHVSTLDALGEAQVSVTFNDGWDALGLTDRLVEVQRGAYRARGFGDFWQHMLVAEGAIDLAIDAVGVAPYDLAALRVIVEEAGGTFTDRHGSPTHLSDTAVSSNGLLHPLVVPLA